jgi:hypothetical protein
MHIYLQIYEYLYVFRFIGIGVGGGMQGGHMGTNSSVSSHGMAKEGGYGLAGLLDVIRMTDKDLNTLALGSDLTTFGLNLNSSDSLYLSFSSPFSGTLFIYIYIYMYKYIYTYIHIYTYIYMYLYIYIYVILYKNVYIYKFVYSGTLFILFLLPLTLIPDPNTLTSNRYP